jgi:hypothetical protein
MLLLAAMAADNQCPRDGAVPPRLHEIAGDFVRVDPETLRPVRGQRAPLDGDSWALELRPRSGPNSARLRQPWARAPSDRPPHHACDRRREAGAPGSAWATAWVSPRRLLGVVVTRADDTIVAGVGPATRRGALAAQSGRVAAGARGLPQRPGADTRPAPRRWLVAARPGVGGWRYPRCAPGARGSRPPCH